MADPDDLERFREAAAEHFDEFDADDLVVQEHRNALVVRPEKDAVHDGEEISDWWDCPECGAPTRVSMGPRLEAMRVCSECDWSFTFPDPSGGGADGD